MLLQLELITFRDLLMGELQTPSVHDVGIFERVPKPQNQLLVSLETPGHLKQSRTLPDTLSKNIIF